MACAIANQVVRAWLCNPNFPMLRLRSSILAILFLLNDAGPISKLV